jgi:ribonuclease E
VSESSGSASVARTHDAEVNSDDRAAAPSTRFDGPSEGEPFAQAPRYETPTFAPHSPASEGEPSPAGEGRDDWRAPAPPARAAEPSIARPQEHAEPAPAAAAAESYALPMESLVAVAEAAGLQWVNSDVGKIEAAQSAMAADAPPVHVAREIKPMTADHDGPLVLVETKKDLSQVKLPFETTPQETQGGY